jgi:ankyrin repeat protein
VVYIYQDGLVTIAAKNGHKEVLFLLLERGADIEAKDYVSICITD